MTRFSCWILALGLTLVACTPSADTVDAVSPAAETGDVFVYTAIPDRDARQLEARFSAVTAELEAALGVPVRYVPVTSYAAAVTAFLNDEVQLAWFGGLSGVQARLRQDGARAIAQGTEDPEYHSLIIAHHSTGLPPGETLTDALRGRTFTFGDKGSTSGRLMPEYFLREHFGEAPEQIFSRVGYSGDHTRTLQLVQSGAYELGVLGYTTWDSEVARGTVDADKVSVIWRSPGYPDYQWTIRGDADARYGDGFTERVQQALLNMTDPDLLARFPRSGFIPARNEDYAPIEATARAVGIIEDGAPR